jgi:hypothetical protein
LWGVVVGWCLMGSAKGMRTGLRSEAWMMSGTWWERGVKEVWLCVFVVCWKKKI